jgi:hypothetical protein
MMFRRWAASSACASSCAMSITCRSGSSARRAAACSVSPSTNSIHHDEHAAVGVADLVDLADEGMIERSGGQRLATETLPRDEVGFE